MSDPRSSNTNTPEDNEKWDSPTSPSSRKRTPSKFAVKLPPPPSSTYGIKTMEMASNSTNSVSETNNNSLSSFNEMKSTDTDSSSSRSASNISSSSSRSNSSINTGTETAPNKITNSSSSSASMLVLSDEEAFKGFSKVARLNTRATFSGRQENQGFNINLNSSANISSSKQTNYLNRYLHSSAIYEDFLFLFGGLNSTNTTSNAITSSNLLSDLSCFHFATRTWTTIETEVDVSNTLCLPRYDHSAVVYGDSMFIFGGATINGASDASAPAASVPITILDDLLEFKFETGSWSSITGEGTRPSKRRGHSCVIYENSMFIFGGLSQDDKPVNDVFEFSFNNLRWNKITINGHVMPKPRYHHSAVIFKDSMFIFGGTDGSSVFSDFFEFKIKNRTWIAVTTPAPSPSAREGHTAVVFQNSMYLCGGNLLSSSNSNSSISSSTESVDQMKQILDVFEFDFDFRKWYRVNIIGIDNDNETLTSDGLNQSKENRNSAKIQKQSIGKYYFNAVVRGDCIFLLGGTNISPNDSSSTTSTSTSTTTSNSQSIDYICLGKDEFEEEFELDEMAKMKNVPKSMWESYAMKKHPSLLQVKERIRPLASEPPKKTAPSYASMLAAARTECKAAVSQENVLQLIMEYLYLEGHSNVVEAIQEESNIKFQKTSEIYSTENSNSSNNNNGTSNSKLMTLLRVGRRRTAIRHKDVFSILSDVAMNLLDYNNDEGDSEVEQVDHLRVRSSTTNSKEKGEQDINIWEEVGENMTTGLLQSTTSSSDSSGSSTSDKKVILAASFNTLVQLLTNEKDKVSDILFMKTFLYTYQSFTTPDTLLKKLIERYHVPVPKGGADDKFKTEVQQPIRSRVCSAIKYWIDKCSWDFVNNEKLISTLNSFIDGPLSRDGNLSLVKQLRNSLNKLYKRRNVNPEEERNYVFGVNPPEPRVPRNIFSPNLTFAQVDEVEIARQLTLLEFNIFSQIMPTELLNKVWTEAEQKHKAPHVLELLSRYDDIVSWVCVGILSVVDNKKNRAKVMEKFIKIAENLKTLKNFQTLFAILTGLNSPPIIRLVQTFAELPPKTKETLNDLTAVMSKDSNWRTYREFLRYSALPCIPFIDVVLKDILIIEEGNQDTVNGLINFQKRQLLFRSITSIQNYQQRPYNLQPVHQIEALLALSDRKGEQELMEMSYKCEKK